MAEVEKPVTLAKERAVPENPAAGESRVTTVDEIGFDKIRTLAEQGHTKSQFKLGMYHFKREEHEKAISWLTSASKMRDMQALFQLAIMHYDGIGTLANLTKGVELLKMVVDNGDPAFQFLIPHAQYNLGMAAFMGYGMPQNDEFAEHYWLQAGKEGDPDGSIAAQSQLGMFYTRRDTKDMKKAFYWHYFAAENGNLESKGALGVMYYTGGGTDADRELAFKCLCEASERGSLYAQGNLVVYYYESRLFTRAAHCAWSIAQTEDVKAAAEKIGLLLAFVRRGVALGCFYYARCLQTGRGVQKNESEAVQYFKKAIEACPLTASELQQKLKNDEL